MSLMAIKIFLVLLCSIFIIHLVTALEYSLEYPSTVEQEKEFTVKIVTQEEVAENYDVKIFVHEHTKEFSEILVGEVWKSPFYYIKEAFPDTTEFILKAHYVGETNLCARLRKTVDPAATIDVCNAIIITAVEISEETRDETNSENDDAETQFENKEDNSVEQKQNEVALLVDAQKEDIIEKQPEKIVLAKAEDVEKKVITKKEKTRLGIIYGFTFLCIIIIVLLVLKKM